MSGLMVCGVTCDTIVNALPDCWRRGGYATDTASVKDEGGHFAAWEQPQIFAQELRAAFKSLR